MCGHAYEKNAAKIHIEEHLARWFVYVLFGALHPLSPHGHKALQM